MVIFIFIFIFLIKPLQIGFISYKKDFVFCYCFYSIIEISAWIFCICCKECLPKKSSSNLAFAVVLLLFPFHSSKPQFFKFCKRKREKNKSIVKSPLLSVPKTFS
ncbi:expressed protein [Phakopsora pachyrhizi]|uniref:Expressed protein n=1 Tax=Phakopsora pachyrhizi TaxID=170000 RepID=A0AAV0BEC7_PHAPC|nr:expressed protein [Phakopsora pachyrhizi]